MAACYQDLGDGIYCIDTGLYRPQMAACYLVVEGSAAAFIDTGTYHTVPLLLEVLAQLGLSTASVQYVIPTHVHLDHAGGAGELMARCPNATLVVHPKGAAHMIDPTKLQAGATAVYGEAGFARDYGKLTPVNAARVITATDGYVINLNGRELRFYATPGHANHHGCLWDVRSQQCFTGDTFGISYREFDTAQGVWLFAPTTPVAFSPDDWYTSLDKLAALQPRAMLLTHYGRVTAVETLLPRLRQSIATLSALALQEENAPDGRVARLKNSIMACWLEEIGRQGCDLSERDSRELLAVDAELNAQGLDIWLLRRSKART
ncbi:MAG: MBL fold metallo-hydrolase [Thiothrix sp.]